MFFNSYMFVLAFLPIAIIGYYFLNSIKKYCLAEIFLLLLSIVFYASFEIKSIPIIAVSILVNYIMGYLLRRKPTKQLLFLGVSFNILVLAGFKYTNFFFVNLSSLLKKDIPLLEILIPIGISFMTFQQISYLVDVYRNSEIKYSLIEYALYVFFFPYVISGPIVRHNNLIPQLRDVSRKTFDSESFAKGLYAFVLGLSKKVLIADTFAGVANVGFNNVQELNSLSAIFAMLAYTIQIYFDFSGYSDMVLGVGKMLNLDMPINFNSPYKATNILEFWKRWHMSLTQFLMEYIYFPLGGNRKGAVRTYINVLVVFLVSGLWHGANWTFIVWGCLHGLASVLNRIFKKKIVSVNQVASWLICFSFVNFTWIFFRANTISDAISFIRTIAFCEFGNIPVGMTEALLLPEIKRIIDFCFSNIASINNILLPGATLVVIICMLLMKNTQEKMDEFRPTIIKSAICSLLLVWCIVSFSGVTSFIYVNF